MAVRLGSNILQTLTGSAGIASTYTMTISAATTVTADTQAQITDRPFGNSGPGDNHCQASTVTMISVSTLCATGSVCVAQPTAL